MKKWRFVSNQNSTIVGINDAGIETFTANLHRSLVREMIQNSLDAAIIGSEEPVTVEFCLFDLERDRVPDVSGLAESICKSKTSNAGEPDAYKFFQEAEKIIRQPTIKVLRISDHNTVGLGGSDICKKGTGWSRLVKESGSSNKGQSAGGSFGIGKSAAFACSDLRTVFFSSIDNSDQNLKSNIGVARLVSFEDKPNGDWTTGVGYYSEDDRFVAMSELADFDKSYTRNAPGTDIYILGMHLTDNMQKELREAVLLDFLVSIVKGRLVVKIQDDRIDKDSLQKYISDLNPYDRDEIRDLIEYHHLLTSADPKIKKISLSSKVYGRDYGFCDGECTLYLREAEGLNRRILITRQAGMRIFEQNRISGSIDFTGVLIIDGENMNEKFKKMEAPSHDAWEPGRCRGEEKLYADILAGLRRYLRNTVKDCYGRVVDNSMDAIGASDFLPDIPEDKDKKIQENALSAKIKSLSGRIVEPVKTRTKSIDIGEIEPSGDSGSGSKKGGPASDSGRHSSSVGNRPGEEKGYKQMAVKKRLICRDAKKGEYLLKFTVPSTVSKGKLEFTMSGEQSDYDLPIKSARVTEGNPATEVEAVRDNGIYLKGLVQGNRLQIEVAVDFDGYCMMEVDYYAHKK